MELRKDFALSVWVGVRPAYLGRGLVGILAVLLNAIRLSLDSFPLLNPL